MFNKAYQKGRACGAAKRKLEDLPSAKAFGFEPHKSLDSSIPEYDRLAKNERSKWFKAFYQGIADVLRETQTS